MAQDITLMGANYSGVPAVTLPKTGGGTANFIDVTDTTAVAADVAQGKVFYLADGSQATGTSSGGGGGGSVSKSDVNFYDYDGTLVASRTKAEINVMSSDSDLPDNPSHTGLTAQGWNWTLTQLKAQLAAIPEQAVNVGQMYVTDDDKTRIYVRFEEGRSSPVLGLGINGTVVVDWGDGSEVWQRSGSSLASAYTTSHVFEPGDYVITIEVISGSFSFFGVSNTAYVFRKNTNTSANIHRVYANAIQKIELGSGSVIGNYAFNYCTSMKSITIPNSIASIGQYAFQYCYGLVFVTIPIPVASIESYVFQYCQLLACVSVPYSVTSLGNYAFRNCGSLASASIPDGVTSIGNHTFNSCFGLASLVITESVTSIGHNTWNSCYGLGEIHFKPTTPPTVSASSAWSSIPTDCKIYVPAGTLEAYTTATNYPSSSTYTYIEE